MRNIRAMSVFALVGVAALAVTGCSSYQEGFSDSHTLSGQVSEVKLDSSSGNVTLEQGATEEIKIYREVRYVGPKPEGVKHSLNSGVLLLDGSCGMNCSISYKVTLPGRPKLSGKITSGDIKVGQVAAVDVEVTSGSVRIGDANGSVNVRSTSGDIEAALTKPADVKLKLTSGTVKLAVPGGNLFHVTTKVTSGEVRNSIGDNPSAANRIDVQSTSGDIEIGSN
ncbi:hypothetical protein D5S17_32660 [Pseudonocardiaceae bacterium YIM PH 21723]|nr:hypothetical protein D5S17_32660 [Pseudonocardiaceae bacterium YIM PH 21723]